MDQTNKMFSPSTSDAPSAAGVNSASTGAIPKTTASKVHNKPVLNDELKSIINKINKVKINNENKTVQDRGSSSSESLQKAKHSSGGARSLKRAKRDQARSQNWQQKSTNNVHSVSEADVPRNFSILTENKKTDDNKAAEESPKKEGNSSKQNSKVNSTKSPKNNNKTEGNNKFPIHLSKEVALKLLESQSPDDVKFIKGRIRVIPKSSNVAYLEMPDGQGDLMINGYQSRNRAFDGDMVVAAINPKSMWREHQNHRVQKTGFVVCILEEVNPRIAIGVLRMRQSKVMLNPRDQRIPKIHIEAVPNNLLKTFNLVQNKLFLAKIVSWDKPTHIFGHIKEMIGQVDDLEAESLGIVLENNLDVTPYPESMLEGLPSADYVFTREDLEDREDWRESCILSIDPATAVDLDDAVSCTPLENGNFEVGVHIADVTHFLKASTPLDKEVSSRATTVYMVEKAYHMLPEQLTRLCSLTPGKDKLCFSVIWEMTPTTAEVVASRIVKTIIKSTCQMSYDQAQLMIDEPDKDWESYDSLKRDGSFSNNAVCEVVNNLYKLAVKLRGKRFDGGALSIDQPKLQFQIDKSTKQPISFKLEQRDESNRLIEEFMLLANFTVAEYLYSKLPKAAFLRIHEPPIDRLLEETQALFQKYGIHLNIESAGALQQSLKEYAPKNPSTCGISNFMEHSRLMVINSLCAKSMTRARYFCASEASSKEDLSHYALNANLYTHFTSPIRRYADCIVHRQLLALITKTTVPEMMDPDLYSSLAKTCNNKKYSAKLAQEQSTELYFMSYLHKHGPMILPSIVVDVKDYSFDAMLCDIGIKVRVYVNEPEDEYVAEHSVNDGIPTIKVTWKASGIERVVNLFSLFQLKIEAQTGPLRIRGTLVPL